MSVDGPIDLELGPDEPTTPTHGLGVRVSVVELMWLRAVEAAARRVAGAVVSTEVAAIEHRLAMRSLARVLADRP